uniref:Apple domain-containing protein n=1 Tax=Caenorhabditis japonica TaxID=281687 RepID=A0A8R1DGM5_CAEJA
MKGWLLLAVMLGVAAAQEEELKTVVERAIDEPGQDEKFKIYVGTIDGVRRELFNEVDGGQIEVAPDNTPNVQDPFGAYDDNNVVSADNEKILFVPKPYRPGGDKKEQKKTTKAPVTRPTRPPAPVTTIRTIPFVQTTPAPFVTLPPVTRPPFVPPQPAATVATVAPQFARPIAPTAPPRVLQPQQPQPIRPIQPFQPQPFQPQPFQPQQFTRAPFTQAPFTQPQFTQAPFTQAPFTQAPFTQAPFTQAPFRPQPTFATRPPPPPPPPATTAAPRFPPQQGQSLRSGTCASSIFYISTPISGPSRLTFTHFAVAVTVDQCARTCHEFNCAIAHYNPLNGHCEFNPSTAFAIRNGQCPAWPSLHYRNNVVANEPVRIFCVTCQRPRRRPVGRRPFRGQARRGQRLGRKTQTNPVAEHQPVSEVNQRQLRAASSENAEPPTEERNSQLNLLKQLEDLQL